MINDQNLKKNKCRDTTQSNNRKNQNS